MPKAAADSGVIRTLARKRSARFAITSLGTAQPAFGGEFVTLGFRRFARALSHASSVALVPGEGFASRGTRYCAMPRYTVVQRTSPIKLVRYVVLRRVQLMAQ